MLVAKSNCREMIADMIRAIGIIDANELKLPVGHRIATQQMDSMRLDHGNSGIQVDITFVIANGEVNGAWSLAKRAQVFATHGTGVDEIASKQQSVGLMA